MKSLGAILVFANLVMSLMFMALAMCVYATHRNWKDLVNNPQSGLKVQVENARRQNQALEDQRTEVQNTLLHERAARQAAIAALETRDRALEQDFARKDKELTDLQAQKATWLQTVESTQQSLKNMKDEVEQVRTTMARTRADRDSQYDRAVSLNDRLNQLLIEYDLLKKQAEGLRGQVGRMSILLDKHGVNEFDSPVDTPPPRDGIVTAVRQGRFVEISLGEDEGLRVGHRLDVYRDGGVYLGRIRLTKTDKDRSVGEVIPQFRKGVIQESDRVITKIQ